MRILITGGAGFIGSHVYDTYRKAGHTVAVIDNFSTGNRHNLPDDAIVFEEDITDLEAMRRIFADFKPDAVNHHAAQISVTASVDKPLHDAVTNIIGSTTLLSCVLEFCPDCQVIYATSGGAMYGKLDEQPYTEESTAHPSSPYGLSKYVAEQYKWLYSRLHKLDVMVLRYSNVFGPRQNPEGEAGVCAIFTNRMLESQPVTIFGDGSALRDYVYVKDVARANLLALKHPEGGSYNISTGIGTSTRTVFETIAKETKYELPPNSDPLRPGEVLSCVLSPAKAEKFLGWKPEHTFAQGIKETVAWAKKNQTC